MKALSVVFVSLISSMVWADPMDMSGAWSINGEVMPSFRVETVIQRTWNEEGKAELDQLRKDGYTCVYVRSSAYRCRRTLFGAWTPSEIHQERLLKQFETEAFELVKASGSPRLITSGDSVNQWQLPVLAYNARGKTHEVIYWEFAEGGGKLQFKIGELEYWPHFTSNEKIYFRTSLSESKGNRQTEFWFDVTFSKN